jgi:flagellar biosynthesis protein FlhF
MAEAMFAARRNHGMDVRVVRAGPRASGGRRMALEVVVEAVASATAARRAARAALARAVMAAHAAAREASGTVAAARTAASDAGAVARLAARLRAQALPEDLVAHVVASVRERIDAAAADEMDSIAHAAALAAVASLVPVSEPLAPVAAGAAGRPLVIGVAGPTGVGKTTTLAKLASVWRIDRGLRVGIVAADAFRVGAVDQLRTYGRILGVAVHASEGPSAAAEALARMADRDVVLVDTPGRGHRDAARIDEVAAVLRAVRADETLLVLPGASSARALEEAVDAFRATGPTRTVLTKLDESEGLGALVGAVRRSRCPASWFTDGQEVPDDIERADAAAFARRMLGDGAGGGA